jgi:hypothetical protein
MPKFQVRKPDEVPAPSRLPKRLQEQQRLYEGFIRELNGNVGELELAAGEGLRSVKIQLRRAATRLSKPLQIWDADGKVYFKAEVQPRRLRHTQKIA